MPRYILLSTLTIEGRQTLHQRPERLLEVNKELEQMGLVPELVELDNPGDQEKDVVVDVSPSGTLEEGDTVTITYYGKPPPGTGPGSGDGEDDEG